MKVQPRAYRSYLLRMWQEQPDGEWRYSLQDTHTKDCVAFATLGELFSYLVQETDPGGGILTIPQNQVRSP